MDALQVISYNDILYYEPLPFYSINEIVYVPSKIDFTGFVDESYK